MRIPVIAAHPTTPTLVESAQASTAPGEAGQPPTDLSFSPAFELDATFSPIPIGVPGSTEQTLESLQPDRSGAFAVRGSLKVDDLDNIPTHDGEMALFADPEIAAFNICSAAPLGQVSQVQQKLDVTQLANAGFDGDGVAVAVLDSGINLQYLAGKLGATPRIDAANSWTPPGSTLAPFQYSTGHGTMCAYDVLIAAPKATLLDFPILMGSMPGGTLSGRTLSVALMGFAQLLAFWSVGFAAGGALRYKALVVNNSWGMYHPSWDFPAGHPGRYIDNPTHPFNVIVQTLANGGADILFAAGNCGANCPDTRCQGRAQGSIMGANAMPDVLTLAGCDVTDVRVGYSSQGPAIAGMAQNKPDVTAYTHFLGSEALGQGAPDSGTSAACPVAAGVVAALRSNASVDPRSVPPSFLFSHLRTTARQVQGTGWNGDYGFGIIDPVAAAQGLGLSV